MTFYNQFPCLTKEGRKEKLTYFSHLFQINFFIGSHPSFTDEIHEIHDPLFTLTARKVESLRRWLDARRVRQGHRKNVGNTPDVYPLMNPAIRLANQVPSSVQKLVSKLVEKKILPNNLYSKGQLPIEGHDRYSEKKKRGKVSLCWLLYCYIRDSRVFGQDEFYNSFARLERADVFSAHSDILCPLARNFIDFNDPLGASCEARITNDIPTSTRPQRSHKLHQPMDALPRVH